MINPKNNDQQFLKWAAIAALIQAEIKRHPERISLLQNYEGKYNWQEPVFISNTKNC